MQHDVGMVDGSAGALWDGLDLAALLALDASEGGGYRSRYGEDNRNGRVFGGQLLGQALGAGQASVDPARVPSALRVLFMQGALPGQPIEYQVTPLQDGKRFSSRRVVASQQGRLLTDTQLTFQLPGTGFEHALPPYASTPEPEQVLSMAQIHASGNPLFAGVDWRMFEKSCLELRLVAPEHHLVATSAAPSMAFWMRLRRKLPDDAAIHATALAYLSDYWINSAAITHHVPVRDGLSKIYVASLNHALWFHRPCRADDWLLFCAESPSAQQGRALTNARIYDRHGVLLASAAQECLLALR